MPVSKPILIALVGAVLAAVAFFGTQGLRAPAAEEAAPAAETASKDEAAGEPAAVAKPTAAKPEAKTPRPKGIPAGVLRANERGRIVVLFFYGRGADDRAVRPAVRSLEGKRRVSVFKAPISDLTDYRALTGALGVAQAPAVVVIGKRGANVIEGYVDEGSLAQEVADAR